VTTPTLPRRKLRPNRLPMGAARWLLGRDPELTDKAACGMDQSYGGGI
jgi:hypothetical protein